MNLHQNQLEIHKLARSHATEDSLSEYLATLSAILGARAALILESKGEKGRLKSRYTPEELTQAAMESIFNTVPTLIQRVRSKGSALEKLNVPSTDIKNLVAFEIERNDQLHLVIAGLPNLPSRALNEVLVRARLISLIQEPKTQTSSSSQNHALANTLEILSDLLPLKRFQLAGMTLCNEICSRFFVHRVSLGWDQYQYVDVKAISHLDKFDKQTESCVRLAAAMEESLDQNEEILMPGENRMAAITRCHETYRTLSGAGQVLSLPVRMDEKAHGVILLERSSGEFTLSELQALRLITNQAAPILLRLFESDQWWPVRLKNRVRDALEWLLGPENSVAKLMSTLVLCGLLYLGLGSWDYDIEVSAELRTDAVSYLSSPLDGVILDVLAHSGDRVTKGQPLIQLDTEEIHLKINEAQAEVTRYQRESQKARAEGRLADMNIADARLTQAQAELERVLFYLSRSELKAPQDGVIIEGEKEKLLGAPITKGDLLYQIASPQKMYPILKVDQRDIDEIEVGDIGEMALLSQPDKKYRFKVQALIPVAHVEPQEGSQFRLKAELIDEAQDWWRPGMSGLARIKAGQRRVGWILFHRIIDHLRLYFWW